MSTVAPIVVEVALRLAANRLRFLPSLLSDIESHALALLLGIELLNLFFVHSCIRLGLKLSEPLAEQFDALFGADQRRIPCLEGLQQCVRAPYQLRSRLFEFLDLALFHQQGILQYLKFFGGSIAIGDRIRNITISGAVMFDARE